MDYEKRERIEAIVRGVIGAAAILLGMAGVTIDQEAWATAIMELACICITLYTWFWKNNNLTTEAAQAQQFLDYIKDNDTKDNGEVPEEVIYPEEE